MEEGWLVQESTFYITKFLTQINPSLSQFTEMETEDEHIMGDKAQGSSKWRRFTEVLREKINNFCICNSEKMVKWIDMYDRAQKNRIEGRKRFPKL